MLAAMLLHGVWDSAAAIGGPVFVIAVLFLTMVFCLVVLARRDPLGRRSRARVHARHHDPRSHQRHDLCAELDALTGHRKDKRAALKAQNVSRRREKHVLRAARDLAEDLAASGGADTPEVAHSRAEISRLRTHSRRG